MRLIDADALVEQFLPQDAAYIRQVLDAAPTVCCEECKNRPVPPWFDEDLCRDDCRCGSEFKRRQP